MASRRPITFSHVISRPASDKSLQTFPPERYSDLVRRRGGFISVPKKLSSTSEKSSNERLTKLLLNVNIERSLGPVQVMMSPQNTVRDLIKVAIEIYVREKRRPLLNVTDPSSFDLHYSQFSLESLKGEEKLIKLGSRNFFMCSKRTNAASSASISGCCSEEAKLGIKYSFPLIKFMDFLL